MQGDYGFDFINILIGFDSAEEQMQLLLNHVSNFLTGKLVSGVVEFASNINIYLSGIFSVIFYDTRPNYETK